MDQLKGEGHKGLKEDKLVRRLILGEGSRNPDVSCRNQKRADKIKFTIIIHLVRPYLDSFCDFTVFEMLMYVAISNCFPH